MLLLTQKGARLEENPERGAGGGHILVDCARRETGLGVPAGQGLG